ncbi:MAG: biopolymer transporter ExbD [Aquificota bacterium]|jgi:biopolymer transport protein ExbD|nr:biopolymer transporter ExbD [Aquificaceae bacterium]MDM7266286.1 biopolymer transporter ExbD [Aquificaceae bacterium]QWK12750.1 MAG: biopolymer transporter ExbD [Aquificota bacterium]HAV40349.1 biopolymer transporter ExbD [Aquificaceae bacterium]HCO39360.1 biopolymer transporter ExbD [Aquificaceae bacterium]
MRRRRLSYDERAYIDVVPLVDTLLAVFLFLALLAFQSPITFLAVKLPFAKEGEKVSLQVYRVQVLKEGKYMVNGKEASLEQIEEDLKNKKPKTMVIEADEDVAHKFVVALMDLGKKSGVENVLIGVRKR